MYLHMILSLLCCALGLIYALAALAVMAPPDVRTFLLKGMALLIPVACLMSPIMAWNADHAGRVHRRTVGLLLAPVAIGLHVVVVLAP